MDYLTFQKVICWIRSVPSELEACPFFMILPYIYMPKTLETANNVIFGAIQRGGRLVNYGEGVGVEFRDGI